MFWLNVKPRAQRGTRRVEHLDPGALIRWCGARGAEGVCAFNAVRRGERAATDAPNFAPRPGRKTKTRGLSGTSPSLRPSARHGEDRGAADLAHDRTPPSPEPRAPRHRFTMGPLLASVLALLALSSASKPRSCQDFRHFYGGKGFAPKGLPQTEMSGEHLRVCPQVLTCCTSDAEDRLSNLSRREFEDLVRESGRTLQSLLTGHYKSFNDYILELLGKSEGTLQSSLGPMFQPNVPVLKQLYSDLRHYYRGSNINLEEGLNDFWARLLERLFKATNTQYVIEDEYLECVAKQSETLRPFGDVPRDFNIKVTHGFVAARTFVQGLVISGEVVRKVSQVPLSQECMRAIMKLTYCPHCYRMISAKPCANYCQNVMKGCLANQADLDTEWRNLADTMLQVSQRFKQPPSIDNVILSIPQRISEAIGYMQENQATFNTKVFQACGTPVETEAGSVISVEKMKKFKTSVEEISTTPSAKLEKLVDEVSQKLRDMMLYWVQLPNNLCADRVATGSGSEDGCWNGMTMGRYLPEVMGDGLASQINNPEVEIDITKPDMIIRQQIMQLKIMTNRLKNALNGNDVDFQDTSDDVSGSGSGACADELCGRQQIIIPSTDRPVHYPLPPEVVKGSGSQNQACLAFCLISLVTLLLRR
ncbi:glypican-1-like [Denticeps clupeoides]|nr:glypican-1-like [Denticeps clupeoides]